MLDREQLVQSDKKWRSANKHFAGTQKKQNMFLIEPRFLANDYAVIEIFLGRIVMHSVRRVLILISVLVLPVALSAQGIDTTKWTERWAGSGRKIGDVYKIGFHVRRFALSGAARAIHLSANEERQTVHHGADRWSAGGLQLCTKLARNHRKLVARALSQF